jgi:hypothetical protein
MAARGSVSPFLQEPAKAEPPQAVPRQPLELQGNLVIGVSKEFIDEICSLAADGKVIPRRLRKQEGSYERNELKKMRRVHYESALAAASSQHAEIQCPPNWPPAYATGQSVHHWWSPWFKEALEPKPQLQGKSRPKWYDAVILAALGVKRVRYAGHWFEQEHCYQVH